MEIAGSFRVQPRDDQRPYRLSAPSVSLPCGGLRGFSSSEVRESVETGSSLPLLDFHSPSETSRETAARYPKVSQLPPLEFHPLQRLQLGASVPEAGFPGPDSPCAFRFSQPLDAFIRSEPADPCGSVRSWGSPSRALFHPCSRAPSPAPFPSCRWVRPSCRGTTTDHLPQEPRICASARLCSPRPPEHSPTSGSCSTRESVASNRLFRPARST